VKVAAACGFGALHASRLALLPHVRLSGQPLLGLGSVAKDLDRQHWPPKGGICASYGVQDRIAGQDRLWAVGLM
jgi:hypothetical protein